MKRYLFKLALFLILGIIINIGVAWGCAIWVVLEPKAAISVLPITTKGGSMGEVLDNPFHTITWSRFARFRVASIAPNWMESRDFNKYLHEILPEETYLMHLHNHSLPPSWEAAYERENMVSNVVWYEVVKYAEMLSMDSQYVIPPAITPYWHKRDIGYDELQQAYWMIQIDDAYGWPFLALRSRLRLAPLAASKGNHLEEVNYAIELPLGSTTRYNFWTVQPKTMFSPWSDWRALPLRPIWPGFIANMIFWTAVLWIGLFGPVRIRQRIRRMSGKCPLCAYNLRSEFEQGCPECGWGRDEDKVIQPIQPRT